MPRWKARLINLLPKSAIRPDRPRGPASSSRRPKMMIWRRPRQGKEAAAPGTFGFLFNLSKLCEIDDIELKRKCEALSLSLTATLTDGTQSSDINAEDLFTELRVLCVTVPKEAKTALETLRYLKKRKGTFPNSEIALRILLTIPVTVASGERSFSKLKLIKNYFTHNHVPGETLWTCHHRNRTGCCIYTGL